MTAMPRPAATSSGTKKHWSERDFTIDLKLLAEREPVQQLRCYDKLSIEWRQYLTPTEISLLMVIFSQTIRYGHTSYGFSNPMLMDGNRNTPGMGLSRDRIIKLLNGLEDRGFISKTRTTQGFYIKVNLDWMPTPATAPISKREHKTTPKPMPASTLWANNAEKTENHPSRGSINTTDKGVRGSANTTYVVVLKLPIIEQAEKNREEREQAYRHSANAGGADSFSSKVFSPARKRQRPSSPGPRAIPPVAPPPLPLHRERLTVSAIETTFHRAFKDTFAGRPGAVSTSWTVKQKGKVKSTIINTWKGTPQELHEFIQRSVKHWEYVIGRYFNWHRSPAPTLPSIDFLCTHRITFMNPYQNDGREIWLASLQDREERRFYELTTKLGKTPEEARFAIAEDRAMVRLRKDIEKNAANAARSTNWANQLDKQLQATKARLRHYEPHPESEIAKKRAAEKLREELGPLPELASGEVPDLMQFVGQNFEDGLKD